MQHNPVTLSHNPELDQPDLFINRELSWIEFNRRVFEQAQDNRHPLLERVKFISIFDANLDEFIMVRLAGLKDQLAARVPSLSPDGLTAEEQLVEVRQALTPLVQEVCQYWRSELIPLLAAQHICILDYEQLNEQQKASMRAYFERDVFPVLTPLAVDQGHPFPHISNRSLNLAVAISGDHFARVKVPPSLPRLAPVPIDKTGPGAFAFVWMEQVIAAHLSMLFPGFDVWESYPFRVLRDADIEIREDDSSDLLESIEQSLRERRFGAVVNLVVNPSMPQHIRDLLLENLEISAGDLTVIDGPLGLGDVIELFRLERPDLKDPPFIPRALAELRKTSDLFAAIRQHDLLMHHPYDTFDSVVEFIREAAHDPDVLAIKQTLYRVGTNSSVVSMLLEAVENGKQVAVLVELKARFDEENNIEWARALERAGVHVVYGLLGLKTHAKIALVVRKEADGLRRYVHLGTGNYNATTARIYEDLCLLTCRPQIGADASLLFNSLTGYSRHSEYAKLIVAPLYLRQAILERIEREMSVQQEHGSGYLLFKMNALVDPAIVRALYRASQAGVRIDLIVRGICCLRPGIPGVSETIHVRSIVGRFLEHSRIYYFANGGQQEVYLGSADMMQRNLDGRVETLFPVEDPQLRSAIYERVLKPMLADTVNARELTPDGRYARVQSHADAFGAEFSAPFDCQNWFITHPLLIPSSDTGNSTMSALPSGA
ncbi:MAG TPA: polyphosphate kinase 1 [Ktedonobacteraceae bacterium]|nr:polyphosphate kinase 1 [Ktedonobacteraceae bacterium]